MSELDGVSAAIGELKGLAKGHNEKLDGLRGDFQELKTQVIKLNTDGCVLGKNNEGRISKIESTRISGKEWGILTGATAVISGIVSGLLKAFDLIK